MSDDGPAAQAGAAAAEPRDAEHGGT
jgi:hypothetical protein